MFSSAAAAAVVAAAAATAAEPMFGEVSVTLQSSSPVLIVRVEITGVACGITL